MPKSFFSKNDLFETCHARASGHPFAASLLRIGVLSLSLLLIGNTPCYAGKTSADLKKIQTKISQEKEQEAALKKEEEKAAKELKALQKKLVDATKDLQDKQEESEKLADKLQDLSKANAAKVAQLETSRKNLSALTSALIQISRDPPEALLLHSTFTTDQIHRSILLRTMMPRVQSAIIATAQDLADLEKLQKAAAEQRRLVTAAEQNLSWQKKNLDDLVKTRQGLLQKTSAQRVAITAQLASLTSEAKDLQQLMQKVSQGSVFPKDPESLRQPSLRQGLRLPVAGRVIRPYGTRDNYGVLSQGLTFTGAAGSPIVAPAAGRVVFVGPFKGYGLISIISHNGGYHSFLAGFGRIDAVVGLSVAAGEPLGVLPDSSPRPELYFEWRRNNEPINPSP